VKIMVEIDGQMMPLADCHWVLLDPDGCTFGSLRGDTALNAEQAHREFTHLQRHRDKQTCAGTGRRRRREPHHPVAGPRPAPR
jgi:hypothetical protein